LQRRYRGGEREIDSERRAAWRTFFAIKEWLHDLRPIHASTVHKSQGSTYQHAFIDAGDIGRCTRADVIARLMYVAVSRAAQTVTLTGQGEDSPVPVVLTPEQVEALGDRSESTAVT